MLKIKNITNYNEIYKIITNFDSYFNPKISSIVTNLEEYSQKIYDRAVTIALYLKKEIIGFASFYCNEYESKIAFLAQISIKKEYENNGYGTMILKKVEEISKNEKMEKLRLEVYCTNKSGLEFYKKNGYILEKKCSKDSVYLIKEL